MSVPPTSKAWMLGPKAENEQEFERLLLQVFRDYCYWRRNFHPEDAPFVTAEDRLDAGFQRYFVGLQDRLFEMLARLKRSVPFFSPRYLGHMNTDLLMPGILGYVAALLYNQNNIVQEAATITLQFETEAMQLVAAMLGLPERSRWGHLCSGGTAANIESLWVARNLKFLPYQVALAIRSLEPGDSRVAVLRALAVGDDGSLGDRLDANRLGGLSVPEILALRDAVERLCGSDPGSARIVDSCSLEALGFSAFSSRCSALLGGAFPKFFRILLSRNAHYSLKKAANVIGFGRDEILFLPLDSRFRLDIDAFRKAADEVVAGGGAVLAAVGVYGSTEEGSVDDFAALDDFRQEWRRSSASDFWLHGDACYGGYALSFLHPLGTPEELQDVMSGLAASAGVVVVGQGGSGNHETRVWSTERAVEWQRQALALGRCDSVSIDPHKLGYIPYPAGAVFYGDYRVRELIRVDAPYLNAAPQEQDAAADTGITPAGIWDTPYLGKYTLEGSRPGAYGAATWLAHKTVPLDRTGHGALVGASLTAVNLLEEAIREEFATHGDGLECHFLCPEPDLNILCYTLGGSVGGRPLSLALVNRVVKRLFEELLPTEAQPTQTRDFVVAMTSLGSGEYGEVLQGFLRSANLSGIVHEPSASSSHNPWRDDSAVAFLRTVVMGPFLLGAKTRSRAASEPRDLVKAYASFLRERVARLVEEERNTALQAERRLTFPGNILVLEDDLITREDILGQVNGISFEGAGHVRCASNVDDALKVAKKDQIIAATVDITLGDREQGGVEFLRGMSGEPGFRGAVVFTSVKTVRGTVESLAKAGGWMIAFHEKPSQLEGRFQAAMNDVMESLWDIVRPQGRP